MAQKATKKRPGRPNPAPINPQSQRLEHVRKEIVGAPTLRDFHTMITKPAPARGLKRFDVSYGSVRRYHFDRDPSGDYLQRLYARWDINPTWIITGEGQPVILARSVAADLDGSTDSYLPDLIAERLPQAAPQLAVDLLAHVLTRHYFARSAQCAETGEQRPTPESAADELAELVLAPMRFWRVPEVSVERFDRYAIAAAGALLAAIPEAPEFAITATDAHHLELVYSRGRR